MKKRKFKRNSCISLICALVLTFNMGALAVDSGSAEIIAAGSEMIGEYPVMLTSESSLPTTPANAISLSGGYPNYTYTGTLGAGQAGYIKFTATQDMSCSAYTVSALDTYIEVYSDVACTNAVMVDYDNNSGHALNAMVYFDIDAGSTYYIKIRGFSNTTSGTYTVRFHRGMPTSGYEKSAMFSLFNSSTYIENTNCYAYALGYYVNPITGNMFGFKGIDPGELDGKSAISMSDLEDPSLAKALIINAVAADCEYFDGDIAEIGAEDQPREGYYKVALFLAPGYDYHWYREVPNGQWTHKPSINSARYTDFAGNTIFNPTESNLEGEYNYTTFLGWFEINTPDVAVSVADIANMSNDNVVYPTKFDLTLDDVESIAAGTNYENVMQLLGEAHGYRGSGKIGYIYELVDGTEILVYFRLGVVDQIRKVVDSGYEIIVGET